MNPEPSRQQTATRGHVPYAASITRFIWRAFLLFALLLAWPGLLAVIDHGRFLWRLTTDEAPSTLPVPVLGTNLAALSDTWGAARSGGRKHEGIDIFAARGTPVTATTYGLVTRIGTNNLGGRVVWVLGPGRQRHYYAHLEDYADIRKGERIAAGTVLGFVGNSGNARGTPPHLHYGIYTGAGAINPYPLLRAAGFGARQQSGAP